jgi:hypothetical protein
MQLQSPPIVSPDEAPWLLPDGTSDFVSTEGLANGIMVDTSQAVIGDANIAEAAPVYTSGSWFRSGTWYHRLEFVMMGQSELNGGNYLNRQELFRNSGFIRPTGIIAIDRTFDRPLLIGDSSPKFEPGMRFTIGRNLGRDAANRDHFVEFSYLGLFEWTAAAGLRTSGPNGFTMLTTMGGVVVDAGVITPIPVNGFTGVDEQSFDYASDYTNMELNLRVQGRPRADSITLQPDGRWVRHSAASQVVSYLAGLRYASLNDIFVLNTLSEIRENNNILTPWDDREGLTGAYTTVAHNDLFGLHGGVELLDERATWHWGVRAKAGGLVNFADRDFAVNLETITDGTVIGGTPLETEADKMLTFVADASVFLGYKVRPNISVQAAYEITYFTGIAESTKNLQLPTPPPLNVTGSRIFNSMTIGIERYW